MDSLPGYDVWKCGDGRWREEEAAEIEAEALEDERTCRRRTCAKCGEKTLYPGRTGGRNADWVFLYEFIRNGEYVPVCKECYTEDMERGANGYRET